ncbi:MAG: T9SS type A sorting domain-containing protein [Bacteroidales bacterium]|nr:T9SS type A sorting domain-containing protein [Bacteroidales bacterium]MCF8457442.1 T9SS type A sorting domain-containing protein [Bacteroidales bacterium]
MKTSILYKSLSLFAAVLFSMAVLGWNTPTQLSPATGSQSWNAVVFDWTPVNNSVAYQFQIDMSSSFNSPNLFDTAIAYVDTTGYSDTHILIDQLYFGTIYHWRVRAYSATDTSAWSPVWTISTRNYVTPVSPALGIQTYAEAMLDWNSHIGVNYYDYQVDTTISFNSSMLISGVETYFSELNSFYDTEQLISNLAYGKTYFWRVRARNLVDTSAWTAATFVTKATVDINGPVSGDTVFTGTVVDWLAFPGSFYYDYQFDTDNSFSTSNLITGMNLYQGSGSGNSDSQHFVDNLLFGQPYFWRVRARNGVDTSAWSYSEFTTYSTVSLDSPADDSWTECAVTLDWLPHAGVDFYDYQIDESSSFSSPSLISGQTTYINSMDGNTDTEILVDPLKFSSTYYWRVRACNAIDTSNWSTSRKIHTQDTIQLTNPYNSASTFTGLVFDWEDFAGCSTYQLQLDTSASFNSTYLTDFFANGISELEVTNLYFGTDYYWRVRGINAVDTSAWSETRGFFTYDQVGLFTPAHGTLSVDNNGVYLDWWYHYKSNGYELEIDTTNTFDSPNLFYQYFQYTSPFSGGTDTEYTTDTLLDNHFYFWRVRVLNEIDTSKWETRWFSTGEDSLILPNAPLLQSPVFGEIEVVVNPMFDWSDVPGAVGYYYQYDVTPDFNNPIEDYATLSEAGILNLQFVTTYYWRARTFDGIFLSPWSMLYHFTTEQETLSPPQLIYPDNGISGLYVQNLTFDWDDVYHAQEYKIEYATDANFLFDYVTDTVSNSEHQAFGFEPFTTYYWHGKSLSDTFNNSVWSSTWTFTTAIALEIPVLISPANLSAGLPFSAVILDWEDVPLADYYQVQTARDLNFTVDFQMHSTFETYYIMSNLDPLELYFWKVKAISDTLFNSNFSTVWNFSTGVDSSVSVQEINAGEINIYPNPSSGKVWITLPEGTNDPVSVSIFNINGQLILSEIKENEKTILLDMREQLAGLYFITVERNGEVINRKILIQK